MSFESIFGTGTLVFGLITTFVGFPSLIVKNRRERRCGIPGVMAIAGFGAFLSRFLYAMTIDSWYLMVGDAVASVLSAVVVLQYFQYRHSKGPSTAGV